jgi:hypothetical protein
VWISIVNQLKFQASAITSLLLVLLFNVNAEQTLAIERQQNPVEPNAIAAPSLMAQAVTPSNPSPEQTDTSAEQLELDPQIIEDSPVLQRWLEEIPNVLLDIREDPSFRTRIRLGYSYFPAESEGGIIVGVEDVFLGQTGLTVSASYHEAFASEEQSIGADLRYYLLPLGNSLQVAPVVGYRHLETSEYTTDGLNLGVRLLWVLSRPGAADISFTQSWVNPGASEEVSISLLSFGYAVTRDIRLSTDWQWQIADEQQDRRFGIVLEWLP